MPLISIITVNKDNCTGLKLTIDSVLSQTFKDYEWIVIDAASNDGSVELIKQYQEHITYWVSEADGGIYVGMNKGIVKATGEYILFLNSGDFLADKDVFESVRKSNLNSDIVLGRINLCDAQQKIIKSDYSIPYKEISLFSLYLYGIPHQASLIKKELFNKYGLYDVTCKINADWKFFLVTLIINNCTLQHIDITLCNFDKTGVSSVNLKKLFQDRDKVFSELIPNRIRHDYEAVLPHYYEVYRMQWLLKHRIFYKIYRMLTSFGIRCFK